MTTSCQQFELYSAEAVVASAHGRAIDASDLQSYVIQLREADWWQRNFPMILHVEAEALAKSSSGSVGAFFPAKSAGRIEMAPVHLVELYVLHEVSHVLASARFGSKAHDPWFAATYLQAVSTYLGPEAYLMLRESFDRGGVDYAGVDFVPAGREMPC